MVLEYRTNDCTWNMVEAPKIFFCRFDVEEDIRKRSDKHSRDWSAFHQEIWNAKSNRLLHAAKEIGGRPSQGAVR